MLRAWSDAPAFVLSCPGPLRRQHAALTPISQLTLPQTLLGAEAQLLAFAAAEPEIAPRCFFTPLPEMFFTPQSLAPLWAALGRVPAERLPVHLRFGGTRSVRVMKEAVNGVVLAEDHFSPPVTASAHPFASGLVLPAAIRRVFLCGEALARPLPLGRAAVQAHLVPDALLAAAPWHGEAGEPELVSLAEFRSANFAAGPVRTASAQIRAAAGATPFVLVPWNLDNPGSAVPALLERALRLRAADQAALRFVIYPFNYPGQTGLIRRLIRRAREASAEAAAALGGIYLARAAGPEAIAGLRQLAPIAWVDGNDPEYAWTARRLAGAGFSPIVLAAREDALGLPAVAADDAVMFAAETRFGDLHFPLRLPSLRALRQLLDLTRATAAALAPPATVPRGRRRKVPA